LSSPASGLAEGPSGEGAPGNGAPGDGRSLLAAPEFRALLGARLTNSLAMSAFAIVVAYQTYDITRDPLSLGWLGLVEAIPALSLVLFGGHVADRRDRRSIILLASALVTLSAAAFAVLAASGLLSLGLILSIIFVTGIASTARSTGRYSVRRPCSRRIAGRTNNSNVTKDETGLPGRPKSSTAPSAPTPAGPKASYRWRF